DLTIPLYRSVTSILPRSRTTPRRGPPPHSKFVPESLTIEKLAAGGAGFSRRSAGEPVFVRGALPGDVISLRAMRQHRGYSEANAWELERPSPQRRAAPCPYAERCGGCDLMALTPDAQRVVKHDMVVEILRRTARIDAS